jgi:O-glycosyl hydrolase
MKKYFLCLVILVSTAIFAQTTVTFDASTTYQTIQGFGASDAWNTDFVGKYWSTSAKNTIAKKLFARTFDQYGNPEGIGLSRWRFNIGAGSSEQGDSGNIELPERRVECFLNKSNSYDWNKQSGQQWFLNQAKEYGVEQLVGFVNSPPRFYNKSGRANSNNTNAFGSTNLKDDCYDDFAAFLVTVLKHFEDSGIHFVQISPVNEPQYAWNEGQEGCPWKNTEIKQLVGELNSAIVKEGLSTKILLAEATNYNDLHQANGNPDKCDQIWKFFSSSRPEYLGGFSNVLHGLGGHSYWTDGDDSTIKSVRENVYRESLEQGGIELYQTEYNLLSKDYDDYITNSIFLGKMIYADLAIANVSIWDYWTAIERERWSQKNRFYLMRLRPTGGDYADLTTGGSVTIDKNLWVLGNYSLFIRPGYKRIKTTGADNLSGLMCSAFISPDTAKIVAVYVNWGTTSVTISQIFSNLPSGFKVKNIKPYVTNADYGLKANNTMAANDSYSITPRSVTTMVVELEKEASSLKQVSNGTVIDVYPNPTQGLIHVTETNPVKSENCLIITDITGKPIFSKFTKGLRQQTIDISDKPSGVYFVQVQNIVKKIIKR